MSVITPPASAADETRLITGEELLAMGDVGPCELIDGRIVPMTPAGEEHGDIELTLGTELKLFVRQRKLGRVVGGETGIYIRRNPDRVRAADIAFISKKRSGKRRKGFLETAPELVVEVISPNDTWEEIRRKLKDYFSIGVERVWVVDPENREVLVYRSPKEVLTLSEEETLAGEGALEGFTLPVANLFEEE